MKTTHILHHADADGRPDALKVDVTFLGAGAVPDGTTASISLTCYGVNYHDLEREHGPGVAKELCGGYTLIDRFLGWLGLPRERWIHSSQRPLS